MFRVGPSSLSFNFIFSNFHLLPNLILIPIVNFKICFYYYYYYYLLYFIFVFFLVIILFLYSFLLFYFIFVQKSNKSKTDLIRVPACHTPHLRQIQQHIFLYFLSKPLNSRAQFNKPSSNSVL